MKAHEVDYRILGEGSQLVEVTLDPGETVIAEAGALVYLEQAVQFETRLGDGADPEQGVLGKLWSAGKRLVTGESLFLTHFTQQGEGQGRVAFAAPIPGSIVAANLAELGGEICVQKDAFLAAAKGISVDIGFNRRLGAGFFGGEGFIMQRLRGDGLAFFHAGGCVVERQLQGETLRVDTGCVVGFSKGIDFDIELVKGLKSWVFGGEGAVLATLSGHGRVWIQSMPFSRLTETIVAHAPSLGGAQKGEQ